MTDKCATPSDVTRTKSCHVPSYWRTPENRSIGQSDPYVRRSSVEIKKKRNFQKGNCLWIASKFSLALCYRLLVLISRRMMKEKKERKKKENMCVKRYHLGLGDRIYLVVMWFQIPHNARYNKIKFNFHNFFSSLFLFHRHHKRSYSNSPVFQLAIARTPSAEVTVCVCKEHTYHIPMVTHFPKKLLAKGPRLSNADPFKLIQKHFIRFFRFVLFGSFIGHGD